MEGYSSAMVAFLVLAQRISHGGLNDSAKKYDGSGGRWAGLRFALALTATPKEMHISIFEKILCAHLNSDHFNDNRTKSDRQVVRIE